MREVKLTQGLVALVDDEDFERLNQFKWFAHKSGRGNRKVYAERKVKLPCGRVITERMHRNILGLPLVSDGRVGDHRNGNGLDNRKSNLAIKTQTENMQNAPGWGASKRKVEEPCL